ncbi:sacsin-like [Watersipora subatra]|uniref:sacsin-like n=1 Tax=Watersipora subatra TaxID=2589382 RepID=UPI00355BDDAB
MVISPQPKSNATAPTNEKANPRKVYEDKITPKPAEVALGHGELVDFSTHMKSIRPTFNRFGQHEPATVRIKNIIAQYVGDRDGCGIEELVKELVQNSDDAQATEMHFILDKRKLSNERVWEEWKSMQGPALCVHNNSVFSDKDIESIQKLGVGSKSQDPDKTGQFGIGFNVVYQLTDCPILLSDHKDICMFDPHLKYVPGACDERPGGHVDLQQDGSFAKLFPDFMSGFLRGQVSHAGCTIFRFPLRQPDTNSKICDMSFAPPDVDAMESVFQSVEFRMFLHSTILFTKSLSQVKVSVIEDDGKLQEKVQVKRVIAESKRQLEAAQRRLSEELRMLISGKLKSHQVSHLAISYHLQTEDDFLRNDWFVNQSFGFHGTVSDSDRKFLEKFYGEESQKFLPVGGVAIKRNTSNMIIGHAYSFLPLPINTGLPVHVNGHFAIHSSRRSIWEHTSFGQWNRILRDHIIAPAYCHLLVDFGKTITSHSDIKQWTRFLPEASRAKDEFFLCLVQKLYSYMISSKLNVIPITHGKELTFKPPVDCLFATTTRNAVVENVLLKLGQNVCSIPEVGLRFKMASIASLKYVTPAVTLECLKGASLKLPLAVKETPFADQETVTQVLSFVLQGPVSKNYSLLVDVPLSLTLDNQLRLFSAQSPVFVDSEFGPLCPEKEALFLHPAINSCLAMPNTLPLNSPIKYLRCTDIGHLVPVSDSSLNSVWSKHMWRFIKSKVDKSDALTQLAPVAHLPLASLSDGRIVSLDEARDVLSTGEASKNMQTVTELGLLRLDSSQLASEQVTSKDISQICTPFMLNAALPCAFLQAIRNSGLKKIQHVKIEHAEMLLQYLSFDAAGIESSADLQSTAKSLPIFEDVDGAYKAINEVHGVVLDSCIPTRGVTHWMEKSNCLLLKEKSAYNALYSALGLEKKNAIDVYLDDIFPNFATFDSDLRMSHLSGIRTSVIPLLKAYADSNVQESFWARLRTLPCISLGSKLWQISSFRDPEVELLTLLPGLQSLPLAFTDDDWLPFLRQAGLKTDVTDEELLECARVVTSLTTAQFSEKKAKLVLDAASSGNFQEDTLVQLTKIRFLPQDSVPVNECLLKSSPPIIPSSEYMSLEGSLVYENDKDRHIFRHCILCWTTRPVLPKWVEVSQGLRELAGIRGSPSVTDVCQHVKSLCSNLPDKVSIATLKSFRKVISYCLDFMQNPCKCLKRKCEDCAVLRSMRDVPFICVKGRQIRVKPTQVVLQMPSDVDADVLYPYVFGRPSDMAKYDDLLRHIGAAATAGPDLYAEILHSLWLDFGSALPLQTNDKQTASLAVYGLFTSLTQQGQRLTTRPLCLPTDKALMSLSTELVVADSESLAKTIKDRGYHYMCSLSSCNISKPAKELICYLPESVRPRLLSQLVTEKVIVDTPCSLNLDCPFYDAYCTRLRSERFHQAVWLIARVPEENRSQFSNDLGRLKLIEVICFHVLYGYLSENGRTLEDSRVERICHLDSTIASARLYIQHETIYPGSAALVNEVAAAVRSVICYNENYFIDTGAIVDILQCETEADIDQYLIEKGLNSREDDMSRPKPGTMISEGARECFLYDPDTLFQPKEYVGFVLKNDDMVYAKIIRETDQTEGREMKALLRVYDLDTGRGYPVQASATDMFKESRRQSLDQCQQLVVSERNQQSHLGNDSVIIAEAKRAVTKLLEEVYSEPTLWRERSKIKKMLLLKWHPDKAANLTLATEVFKHLKSEIDRVGSKYSLSDDEEEGEEEEIYEWEEEEQGGSPQNNTKQEKPHESVRKMGDIEAAQVWLRQSAADLQTAQHLLGSSVGYEWACYISCEVIRKIMVATIVAKSELTMELESTRFPTKLFDAISRIADSPKDELALHLYQLNKLRVDETSTRQPGVHTGSRTPADIFTEELSSEVLKLTNQIHTLLLDFILTVDEEAHRDS